MKEIDDLIETLEIMRDAILARDRDKAFEAVTVCLVQFIHTLGHDQKFFSTMFQFLEELKNNIQQEQYDESMAHVLAWLAKLRSVRALE